MTAGEAVGQEMLAERLPRVREIKPAAVDPRLNRVLERDPVVSRPLIDRSPSIWEVGDVVHNQFQVPAVLRVAVGLRCGLGELGRHGSEVVFVERSAQAAASCRVVAAVGEQFVNAADLIAGKRNDLAPGERDAAPDVDPPRAGRLVAELLMLRPLEAREGTLPSPSRGPPQHRA